MKPKQIFDKVRRKRNNLTELEAREILKHYKIPIVKGEVVKTIEQALNFVEKNGYPVVLKVVSPQIVHKTDFDAVILNIRNEKQLYESFSQIVKNVRKKKPRAKIQGIFIQEMMEGGYEVFVGGKKDQTFDQTIAFGLGGVFVEVFDDVSFRIVPISKKDASEMIREIKGSKVLAGYRGKKPADFKSLVDVLTKTSRMLEKNPEIQELDINPIFALPDRAVAVDARIIIK